MNVQGHLVEVRRRKVLMPFWHGLFSLGAVSGALAGALAASTGLPIAWQLPGVSMLLMVALWWATTRYIPDAGLHPSARSEQVEEPIFDEPQVLASDRSPANQLWRSAVHPVEILLGIITFATALGEGAANDWLALMLVDNRGAPPAVGALTMQVARRVHALAQEQDDPTLMVGAYNALAATLFFLGDFESARKYAMCGVQIWRSGNVQSHTEDYYTPAVGCLCYEALSEWHLGEIACSHANIDQAISLAKELNDTNALALALNWAPNIAYYERDPAEVDHFASDLIELSTRHNFVYFLTVGAIYRGWARSASGYTVEGISWIEHGIGEYRASGLIIGLPSWLQLKAEALHLADRTSEALEVVNEAEALVEWSGVRYNFAELHRLRGVFLAAIGGDETQIEASFCEAIRIAKEQKSVSLEKRAVVTYAEYRRQKASGLGGRGFPLPLC
jgi:tetratricopeptide (TPR) repeat protein